MNQEHLVARHQQSFLQIPAVNKNRDYCVINWKKRQVGHP